MTQALIEQTHSSERSSLIPYYLGTDLPSERIISSNLRASVDLSLSTTQSQENHARPKLWKNRQHLLQDMADQIKQFKQIRRGVSIKSALPYNRYEPMPRWKSFGRERRREVAMYQDVRHVIVSFLLLRDPKVKTQFSTPLSRVPYMKASKSLRS